MGRPFPGRDGRYFQTSAGWWLSTLPFLLSSVFSNYIINSFLAFKNIIQQLNSLKVLSNGKGGGWGHKWYQSIGLAFVYISANFFKHFFL
jgi:hypothetical protein